MKRRKEVTAVFESIGHSYFPVDMLRHDQCWPTGQEDVATISQVFDSYERNSEYPRKPYRVSVTTHQGVFTDDLWASFGWKRIK